MSVQPVRNAVQRRFSETDLDRLRRVVDPDDKPLDSQSESYRRERVSPPHSLQQPGSSYTPPKPILKPPRDDLRVAQAHYAVKKKKGRRWTPFGAFKDAALRLRPRGGKRGDVGSERSKSKPFNGFVRHVAWKNVIIDKSTNGGNLDHMMSSALPDRDSDSIQSDSIISASLNLDDAELSELAERHSPLRISSFDRNFAAADILRPSGFDAFSDVFSRQGIHELSRSATPRFATYDWGSQALGLYMRCKINDARLSLTGGQTKFKGWRMDSAETLSAGIAATLPTEVLQAIYDNLGPLDFNAARHTCISWITASLDVDILAEQLKRAGWWTKASCKSSHFQEWRPWPMSCYFARECALSGDWTGHGLSFHEAVQSSPIIESCEADFRPFVQSTSGSNDDETSCSPVCTTSTCGRYLIQTAGAEIYTYEIEGRSLRLLSRTSCEKRVLAVTIDATPEKFVLAALLQGRIGVCIDMIGNSEPVVTGTPWESAGTLNNASTASAPIMDFGDNDGAGSREVAAGDRDEVSMNAASIGESTFLHQSVEIVPKRSWSEYFHGGRARLRGIRQLPPLSGNGVWPSTLNFNEKGKGKKSDIRPLPQLVYRNICFEDNPPTSIAISPTRQCVAFGCKGGVEIYWIDPTTGQNLNRYFPLAKPSDHLYFLPPRRHIDSTLRLRLISSAVYTPPEEDNKTAQPKESPQTSFWLTLTSPWRFPLARAARQQTHGVDHSYAIPLSDGHHILFTDNETGLFCMGSDTPVGNIQRLSRKFVFHPPTGLDTDAAPWMPRLYTATKMLDNGARIVTAYGDNIVLYSVPIDALRYSTAEQEETIQDSSKPFEELEWLDILSHPTSNSQAVRESARSPIRCDRLNMLWAHHLPSFGENQLASLDTLWPLRIQGTLIGSLGGLRALSVQETVMDGLIVWAVSTSGLSKAWEVDNGHRPFKKAYSTIMSDGIVREGGVPMNDGNVIPEESLCEGEKSVD